MGTTATIGGRRAAAARRLRGFGLTIVAAVLPAIAAIAACAAESAPEPFAEVLAVHRAQDNVGLAVVLVDDGEIVAQRYEGQAVVEADVPVTAATRFQVMSITKAFVGTALLKTLAQGRVDLDAPVQTWLPDWPEPAGAPITLRRLLAHTAGVPHLGHPDRKALYVEHFDTATEATITFRDRPLLHEPGTAYAYSSSGYTLIAAVLEAVHDAPFAVVLERLVLDPLGLADTAPGNVQRPTSELARNYSYIDLWTYAPVDELLQVPTWDFSYNAGGGNLVTTARDLARFGAAFTAPGYFDAAELAQLCTAVEPGVSPWSFGWFVGEDDAGDCVLSTSGATPGVQAGLQVRRGPALVIATLANAWGRGSAGGDLVVGAPGRALDAWMSRGKASDTQRTDTGRPRTPAGDDNLGRRPVGMGGTRAFGRAESSAPDDRASARRPVTARSPRRLDADRTEAPLRAA